MRFEPQVLDPDLGVRLIETAGSRDFASLLLGAAREHCEVDELFAFALPDRGVPEPLAQASMLYNNHARIESYVRRFHHHDPLLGRYRAVAAGAGFRDRIDASEIGLEKYRTQCFTTPAFAQKISFGWRWPDRLLVVSFYARCATTIAPDRLGQLAGWALVALNRKRPVFDPDKLVQRIEDRLASRFPGMPQRELEVCARSILGRSSAAIGLDLGIAGSSVLTYRQRSYKRCGASTAADFVRFILN